MSVRKVLATFRRQFPDNGAFDLLSGESINEVVRANAVTRAYGVYLISLSNDIHREIVYIGKAGTIRQNGGFGQQTIRKRLTMKQDNVFRRIYFQKKMEEANLASLHFEWFVTFGGVVHIPPFLAESQLLAEFFDEFECLPLWNKEA